MEKAIARSAKDAEDVCAGLQVFLDNIPQRDAGIYESIHELLSLIRGLAALRIDVVQYRRLPTPLEEDVRLLLQSMTLSINRIQKMFGETRAKKLNGERPYSHVWYEYCADIEKNEGGFLLWPRLELYSIFLKQLLEGIRGEVVEHKSLARHRQKLTRLLHAQQPKYPEAGYPLNDVPSPASPQVAFPPMPGFWPNGPPPPHGFPFPIAGEPPRPYVANSPALSSASWGTSSSATGASAGSFHGHWAQHVFNGRHSSTRFPKELRERSQISARDMPSAIERLADEGYVPVCKMTFESDELECRFYVKPKDCRARLLLATRDRAGLTRTFCIPLTALKLTRDHATLELYSMDRDAGTFHIWARLNFVDHERLVLFYSTFAALKNQDMVAPSAELHEDYFYTKKRPEEEMFGGQTIYPPTLRHALRMYQDKYTGGIRLEARPLRGPKLHVPLWTAFITRQIRDPGWLRRPGPNQVELKRLEQHVFVDSYIPTLGKNGRFVITFVGTRDCDSFIAALQELAAE